jgi:uncharacterized protein (UPF0548 family)
MSSHPLLGPARVQRRLERLTQRPINFDPAVIAGASAPDGWNLTDLCQTLPGEAPGAPEEHGSWQVARRLMSGYEFADPSIVHAYYDPDAPLQGRNMLLKLQAFGIAHLYVGVRVNDVYEYTRELAGGSVRVWGWSYQTLEGHVEMGQMHWEVWKWLADGRVEFRVHALSREAPIRNPIVRLGFHLVRGHERDEFLQSTQRRMLTFTELALSREHGGADIERAAATLTSRPSAREDPAHAAVAEHVSPDQA